MPRGAPGLAACRAPSNVRKRTGKVFDSGHFCRNHQLSLLPLIRRC
jgi:hypothetical protein